MGKSITPKFRIEMSCIHFLNQRREIHRYGYSVAQDGVPSADNAKKFRDGMNRSFQVGGTNEHLNGTQSPYSNARIINQKTGECVAEYIAPMFEIV